MLFSSVDLQTKTMFQSPSSVAMGLSIRDSQHGLKECQETQLSAHAGNQFFLNHKWRFLIYGGTPLSLDGL